MLAAWKAGAGFVRITICFHLISALPPKPQTTRFISGPQAIRCGRISSNEIKLGHGFDLRNFGRQPRAERSMGMGMKAQRLKWLFALPRQNDRPDCRYQSEPQLMARSNGATTMLAICPVKPGLIFQSA